MLRPLRLVYFHLGAWACFLAVEAMLPFGAASGNLGVARALCVWYAIIVAVIAIVVGGRHSVRSENRGTKPQSSDGLLARTLAITTLIAIVGAALQFYDKTAIQGIDYTQGIARARYAWATAAESRAGGVSSLASVIGNLAAPFFVVALAYLWLEWEHVSTRVRVLTSAGGVATLAATSALTGGRSILLVALACLAGASALRLVQGRSGIPGSGHWRSWAGAGGAIALALVWFGYVFTARARANGLTIQFYVDLLLPRLLAVPTAAYATYPDMSPVQADARFLLAGVSLYAVHGLYVFASVLTDIEFPGTFLGAYPGVLMAKLGVIGGPPEPYAYVGLFMPVPGAFYYEAGLIGLTVGAIAHGLTLGLAVRRTRFAAVDSFAAAWIIPIIAFTVLAPIVPAIGLLIFPLVTAAFLATALAMTGLGDRSAGVPQSRPIR